MMKLKLVFAAAVAAALVLPVKAQNLKLRAAGHCILFSSHVMQEVAALCDDIVIVDKGRVVAAGTPEALRTRFGSATL